jgi:hypothetical protein
MIYYMKDSHFKTFVWFVVSFLETKQPFYSNVFTFNDGDLSE